MFIKPREEGDLVTIKKVRNGSSEDYQFNFPDEMLEDYGGHTFRIYYRYLHHRGRAIIPDDGYAYKLEDPQGTPIPCTWVSSMFENPERFSSNLCDFNSKIGVFVKSKQPPKFNFNL